MFDKEKQPSGELAGEAAHASAVAQLRASFEAIPAGATVRLAKKTSNLFRPREKAKVGLDVSGLTGVIRIDADARTADVQGMCTYENLVAATLEHGLMPLVVPQLRTITLGGAVTGLGIESTSFKNGLPHESVLEMDILTGTGELLTASPTNEHSDLFRAFPNSYGSLGYATRLRIELQPIGDLVETRNVRFASVAAMTRAIDAIVETREWQGERVDGLDGMIVSKDEAYLVLANFFPETRRRPSDYTGQNIFYKSISELDRDTLSAHDYIWRWDTDWFWCSDAFFAQNPKVRRVWPRKYRRSDFYHRIVGWENRWGFAAKIDEMRGELPRERVVQDVEVPLEQLETFMPWFDEHVGMTPVWVCPLRLRGDNAWPLYQLEPNRTYVNVGFWGTVAITPGRSDGDVNRDIEAVLPTMHGHKSLYSDVYYDAETFEELYGAAEYRRMKTKYDPQGRLPEFADKMRTHA
ncbi:FAD-binding oxidoreductase [Dermacoccus nishinomiyaensis]|uniref:FAD-binding oxidoreductase n=1 Tax=Dermacoccus nishinomiyaensis TaxID=1274 RepID=UPI0030D2B2AF